MQHSEILEEILSGQRNFIFQFTITVTEILLRRQELQIMGAQTQTFDQTIMCFYICQFVHLTSKYYKFVIYTEDER